MARLKQGSKTSKTRAGRRVLGAVSGGLNRFGAMDHGSVSHVHAPVRSLADTITRGSACMTGHEGAQVGAGKSGRETGRQTERETERIRGKEEASEHQRKINLM